MDFKKIILPLEKILNTYPDKFSELVLTFGRGQVDAVLNKILNNISLDGGRFDADSFTKNQDALIMAFSELDKSINTSKYNTIIGGYLLNIENIIDQQQKIAKDARGLNVSKFLKEPTKAQQNIIDKTIFDLKRGGIKLYFIDPIRNELMRALQTGASIESTRERLLQTFGEDKLLARWATQTANDGLRKFSGQVNQDIGTEFGFEKYIYIGRTVAESRALCKEIMSKYNGELSKAQLAVILKKYAKAKYLYPNTNINNFAVNTGGHKCLHTCYLI